MHGENLQLTAATISISFLGRDKNLQNFWVSGGSVVRDKGRSSLFTTSRLFRTFDSQYVTQPKQYSTI